MRAFVTVLDANGQTVKGLRRENFALSDAPLQAPNREQVADFTARSVLEGGQHLGVALVLDRSGSMKGKPLAAAQRGASEFLTRISQGDRLAVLSFATQVRADCPANTDPKAARAAIDGLVAGGDTALYDAALQAVQTVGKMQGVTRRAVILLTDGQRTTGQLKGPEAILQTTRTTGVRLFTIGLGNEPEHEVLSTLAAGSGGVHLRAATPDDLLGIYQRIADRLQNEYVLSLTRTRSPAFRELTVTVTRGHTSGSGTRKYRPVMTEEPVAVGGGAAHPPAAGSAPEQDLRPIVAGVVWALVLVAIAALAMARRRLHG